MTEPQHVPETFDARPTQVKHPRQAALRTAFQALVGLAVVLPLVIAQTGLQADQVAWLAPILAVCAAVARVMAVPQVNAWLTKVGLGTAPKDAVDEDPPEEFDTDDTEETDR